VRRGAVRKRVGANLAFAFAARAAARYNRDAHFRRATMGKGDRRSRRGKIWRGTTGKTRPKKKKAAPGKRPAAPVKSTKK
jgi:30S ribosomal protein S31